MSEIERPSAGERPVEMPKTPEIPESVRRMYASRPLPPTPDDIDQKLLEKEGVLERAEELVQAMFPGCGVSKKACSQLQEGVVRFSLKTAFQNIREMVSKMIQKSRQSGVLARIHTVFKKRASDLKIGDETADSLAEADKESDTVLFSKKPLSDKEMHDREVLSKELFTGGLFEETIEEEAVPVQTKSAALASLELRKESLEQQKKQIENLVAGIEGLSAEEAVQQIQEQKLFGDSFYKDFNIWDKNYQQFINKIQKGDVAEDLEGEVNALVRSGGEESTKTVSQKEIDALTADQKMHQAVKYSLEWFARHEIEPKISLCDKSAQYCEKRVYNLFASGDTREAMREGKHKVGEEPLTELVNVYTQSVKVDGNPVHSFLRSGALGSDTTGQELVSLPELLAIQKDPKGTAFREVAKRLEKQGKKELAPYQENEVRRVADLLGLDRGGDIREDTLDASIAMKKFILEQRAVKYIQLQMERHPELIQEDRFPLLQLSLLHLDTRKEAMMAEEMEYVFKAFDGKTVRFEEDLSEAYLDADGTICMPPPQGVDARKTVSIKPLLANVSVHRSNVRNVLLRGKTPSSDELLPQNKINRETFEVLSGLISGPNKKRALDLLEECERDLFEKKESSYQVARKLAMVAYLGGVPLGINCFSGKDRTGGLAYLHDLDVTEHALSGRIGKEDEPKREKLKKLVSEWELKALNSDSLKNQIARMNACTQVKIFACALPGYMDTVGGVIKGVVAGVRLLKNWCPD